MKTRRLAASAAIALATAGFGCSDGPASLDGGSVSTVPAKGKVSQADGSPLNGGIIQLQPLEGSTTQASGTIQADGTFVLRTRREGDGAVPGTYRVVLESSALKTQKKAPAEIKVEVKSGGQDLDIRLQ